MNGGSGQAGPCGHPVGRLQGARALLPGGWSAGMVLDADADGRLAGLRPAPVAGDGLLLPGMPNCHSHAFQRALAGRSEWAGPGTDSFWSWREGMYALARRLDPAAIEVIATWLYTEMLEAGYTTVCEFHYLHHAADGRRHEDIAATSRALLRAAAATGIRLTLLPVLYQQGGFGGLPPTAAQRGFVLELAEYLALLETLRAEQGPGLRIGIGLHSLRAVSPAAIEAVLEWRAAHDPQCPVHIHVAEQAREVAECLAWSGRRPVQWLLERGLVDEHWCLVHATHMDTEETQALAASGAVVALCPGTEANLGDGLFPLAGFLDAGGRIGIGSDSQVTVDPLEELRWLEYGQRLVQGRRNVAASAAEPHCGARLFRAALAGGAAACGQPVGALATGHAADVVELDGAHPVLAGAQEDELLDRLVFAGRRPPLRRVLVAGRELVDEGRHRLAASAGAAFAALMREAGRKDRAADHGQG